MKSRQRSRMEDARPDPCGVGRKVQNAIIGYAIHDSLDLAGRFGGESPGGGGGGAWTRMRWCCVKCRVTMEISPAARTCTSSTWSSRISI
jgi:hypothetical protein